MKRAARPILGNEPTYSTKIEQQKQRSGEGGKGRLYFQTVDGEQTESEEEEGKNNGIHPLWIRSGAVSVGLTLLRVCPFVDGVEEWSIKKSERASERVLFDVHQPPPARLSCVCFSSGFFFFFLVHPTQLFFCLFSSFHLGFSVYRHTISITLYCPCRSLIQLSPRPKSNMSSWNGSR